jgi:UTP-glucose-1-phosphate uridylyltransferase
MVIVKVEGYGLLGLAHAVWCAFSLVAETPFPTSIRFDIERKRATRQQLGTLVKSV